MKSDPENTRGIEIVSIQVQAAAAQPGGTAARLEELTRGMTAT